MADGFLDKAKFTGTRTGSGPVTGWVRVPPYRLPTDVKAIGDRVFLEVRDVNDDTIWEHAWYEIGAGGQLTVYRVVDTHARAGEYNPAASPPAISFGGPVEVGAIANSVTLPVIGPDGRLLNGKAVRDSVIFPDIVTLQARDDLADGDIFFTFSSLYTPSGGGTPTGAGPGLLLQYDIDSAAAPNGVTVFDLSSGAPGRLIKASLEIQAEFIRNQWSVYADGAGVARLKQHALARGAAGADAAWQGLKTLRGVDGDPYTETQFVDNDRHAGLETSFARWRSFGGARDVFQFDKPIGLPTVAAKADVLSGRLARVNTTDKRIWFNDPDRGVGEIPLMDGPWRAIVPTIADLRLLRPDGYRDGELVLVAGSGFRGDDTFEVYWAGASSATDNGFDVFKPDFRASGAPWVEAGRFLAVAPIRAIKFANEDATPSVAGSSVFTAADTAPAGGITAFDNFRNNKRIKLQPGAADVVIKQSNGALELPGRRDFTLRSIANGGSPIILEKENGVVSLIDGGEPIYVPSLAGAITRTVQDKLGDLPTIKDMLAGAGDGATNVAATLERTDVDFIILPPGNYRVSTNCAPTKEIALLPGAKLTIDTGITLNMAGCPSFQAPLEAKVFFGAGAVSNLDIVHLAWFAADKINTATDAQADITKAAAAVGSDGILYWPRGYLTSGATAAIVFTGAQRIVGFGPSSSQLFFSGATTHGFKWTTKSGGSCVGVAFERTSQASLSTAGVALEFNTDDTVIFDCRFRACYDGIKILGTSGGGTIKAHYISKCTLYDSLNSGIWNEWANDTYIFECVGAGTSQYMAITMTAGPAISGTITGGTSGATAQVQNSGSSLIRIVPTSSASFVAGETITDNGGSTATLNTLTAYADKGLLRLFNQCEAVTVVGCDFVGGRYSLFIGAAANTLGLRPAYCLFVGSYFDFAVNGVTAGSYAALSFVGCWISNRPEAGAVFGPGDGLTLNGCIVINSWKHGLFFGADALHVVVIGCLIGGNDRSGIGFPGVEFAANCNGWALIGNIIGAGYGFGTQAVGVRINAGCKHWRMIGNDLTGNTTAVDDSSANDNHFIEANLGYKTEAGGQITVVSGTTAASISNPIARPAKKTDITVYPVFQWNTSAATKWEADVNETTGAITITLNANPTQDVAFIYRVNAKGLLDAAA